VSLPEVEGLTVTYSKSIIALGAVSIDIGEGQAVALLGNA
jgi:ABC-type phosphate/phosphonate transport system ATPase subunit